MWDFKMVFVVLLMFLLTAANSEANGMEEVFFSFSVPSTRDALIRNKAAFAWRFASTSTTSHKHVAPIVPPRFPLTYDGLFRRRRHCPPPDREDSPLRLQGPDSTNLIHGTVVAHRRHQKRYTLHSIAVAPGSYEHDVPQRGTERRQGRRHTCAGDRDKSHFKTDSGHVAKQYSKRVTDNVHTSQDGRKRVTHFLKSTDEADSHTIFTPSKSKEDYSTSLNSYQLRGSVHRKIITKNNNRKLQALEKLTDEPEDESPIPLYKFSESVTLYLPISSASQEVQPVTQHV